MTPEEVLSCPPKVLSQQQREFYFKNGYLLLERIIRPGSDGVERRRRRCWRAA